MRSHVVKKSVVTAALAPEVESDLLVAQCVQSPQYVVQRKPSWSHSAMDASSKRKISHFQVNLEGMFAPKIYICRLDIIVEVDNWGIVEHLVHFPQVSNSYLPKL